MRHWGEVLGPNTSTFKMKAKQQLHLNGIIARAEQELKELKNLWGLKEQELLDMASEIWSEEEINEAKLTVLDEMKKIREDIKKSTPLKSVV